MLHLRVVFLRVKIESFGSVQKYVEATGGKAVGGKVVARRIPETKFERFGVGTEVGWEECEDHGYGFVSGYAEYGIVACGDEGTVIPYVVDR